MLPMLPPPPPLSVRAPVPSPASALVTALMCCLGVILTSPALESRLLSQLGRASAHHQHHYQPSVILTRGLSGLWVRHLRERFMLKYLDKLNSGSLFDQ